MKLGRRDQVPGRLGRWLQSQGMALGEVGPQSLSVGRLGPGKPGRQEPQLEMFGTVQDWRGGSKYRRGWERAKKGN